MTGWKVNISNATTGFDRYTNVSETLYPDTYTVLEYMPVGTHWKNTTPVSVTVVLQAGDDTTVKFGNLCLGEGGGHTLGFWSNKNGQALIDSTDLANLSGLNLTDAAGGNFDPATNTSLRSWLLGASATNMAHMLSAQLAAMELNVYNGFVDGNAIIYAPGAASANTLGYATVNAVVAEANAELGLHPWTPDGSVYRDYQEDLKDALDNANNNLNFVQPVPCAFSFAEILA
jgi:hypothetical protein